MDGHNSPEGSQVAMVQPQVGTIEQLASSSSSSGGAPPPMDSDDWRAQLPFDYRQWMVDTIMETLKKHQFSVQEGLQGLKNIAVRHEEKIYSAATSQSDYLRKISLMMTTLETNSQSPMANSLQCLKVQGIPGGGQVPLVQPQAGTFEQLTSSSSGAASTMDPNDWRARLPLDSRQWTVDTIMGTLKKLFSFHGEEELHKLRKIAAQYEEKIYSKATSQFDYLRNISLKMLTVETISRNGKANSLQTGAADASRNSSDIESNSMQSQSHNLGLTMPIVSGQSQGPQNMQNNTSVAGVQNSYQQTTQQKLGQQPQPQQTQGVPIPHQPQGQQQQLLSQNMQNNVSAASMQSSGSLASTLPAVSNLTQGSITNAVGRNSNLENMQNNSSVAQNSAMGQQGMQSNIFDNSQRQMQGRQQQVPQQPLNQAHLLYNQQFHQQAMKQNLQPGGMSMTQPMMQSHAQKQQQQHQNLIYTAQMQSSQQSVMQPTVMQPASLSGLQQNHQSSGQQSSQQMLEQQPQPFLRQHQQQQTQQVPILHQQQTSMAQQPMMQTAQQMLTEQQQLMISRLNLIPNMHQQLQMGGGVSGLQRSTVLGMPSNRHSLHMLQQKVPVQQQMQQNVSLLQNQTQQPSQQQMVSRNQPRLGQTQHLQRDMQQWLPTSGAMLQQQNLVVQNQFCPSQQAMQEASSTSTAQTGNAGAEDWREEAYQKIKSMKDMYLQRLNEMYQRCAAKLQQHAVYAGHPEQPTIEQLGKLQFFKVMLERLVQFLRISKNEIQIDHKDKLDAIEKQITNILNANSRPLNNPVALQQGQLPQPGIQNPRPQTQPLNPQTSATNNLSVIHPNTSSYVPSISYPLISSLPQPYYSLQNNSLLSPQQVAVNSLVQNKTLSGPQSVNLAGSFITGTPLLSAKNPFIFQSSTSHVAPSPVYGGESEKVNIGHIQAANVAGSSSLSLAPRHPSLQVNKGHHLQAPNAEGTSVQTLAISTNGESENVPSSEPNTNSGHLEAPNAAGSSVLPLSIVIGESEVVNASLSSQPNTHIIHLQVPNPAGPSAKPLSISIKITIA